MSKIQLKDSVVNGIPETSTRFQNRTKMGVVWLERVWKGLQRKKTPNPLELKD